MDINELKIEGIGTLSYKDGKYFIAEKEVTTGFLAFCSKKKRVKILDSIDKLKYQIRKYNFENMK